MSGVSVNVCQGPFFKSFLSENPLESEESSQ